MIKIFIDFDGTITRQDVGDAMFIAFGGQRCRDDIETYRAGLISAVECFRRECAACREADKHKLDEFIDTREIDVTFHEFHGFCREFDLEHYILSDGMDYYIGRILARQGIQNIPVFANHLDIVPMNGTSAVVFQPAFPFTDEVCDRCACCKRNHILSLSSDDDIIIYIGEGYSDRCPVRYADFVFAKDELLTYCRKENISYFEYRTFSDVTERMRLLLKHKDGKKHFGLKKRRQAQLAAREVFLGG